MAIDRLTAKAVGEAIIKAYEKAVAEGRVPNPDPFVALRSDLAALRADHKILLGRVVNLEHIHDDTDLATLTERVEALESRGDVKVTVSTDGRETVEAPKTCGTCGDWVRSNFPQMPTGHGFCAHIMDKGKATMSCEGPYRCHRSKGGE